MGPRRLRALLFPEVATVQRQCPWRGHHEGSTPPFEGWWQTIDDALVWGRERHDRVFVDVASLSALPPGRYSAGRARDDGLPSWPDVFSEARWPERIEGDYGIGVWIGEVPPTVTGTGVFTVLLLPSETTVTDRFSLADGRAEAIEVGPELVPLDVAYGWARGRATEVVIGTPIAEGRIHWDDGDASTASRLT